MVRIFREFFLAQLPLGKNKQGLVVLVLMVVAGTIILFLGMLFIAAGSALLRNSASSVLKKEALALNLACAEEALFQVYLGAGAASGSVTIDDNICYYNVTNADLNGDRIITVSSNIGGAVRKTKIIFRISDQKIRIRSWQEVADF